MNLSKIDVSTTEGDTMLDKENAPKRQVNVYFPKDLDDDVADAVHARKKTERTYSTTALVEEATRLYLMVLRYHKEARSIQTPYDFTRDSLKTFLDSTKKRK